MGTIFCFAVEMGAVLGPLMIVKGKDAKVSAIIASLIGGFMAFCMAWWVRLPLMYPGGQLMTTLLFTALVTLIAYFICR